MAVHSRAPTFSPNGWLPYLQDRNGLRVEVERDRDAAVGRQIQGVLPHPPYPH